MRQFLLAAFAASVIAIPANAADVVVPNIPAIPPPTAAPTVAGYVGAYGGIVIVPALGILPVATIDAAFVKPLQRMELEVELRAMGIFQAQSPVFFTAAILHAYHRSATSAYGALIGVEPVIQSSVGYIFHLGAEAAMFRGRTTLVGQVAGVYVLGPASTWGAYIRGVTRFFPRDNVRLELGARYLYLATLGSIISGELEGEFQLPGRPLSLLANTRVMYVPGQTTAFTVQGGIRFNFGGGDLIDQRVLFDTMPLEF